MCYYLWVSLWAWLHFCIISIVCLLGLSVSVCDFRSRGLRFDSCVIEFIWLWKFLITVWCLKDVVLTNVPLKALSPIVPSNCEREETSSAPVFVHVNFSRVVGWSLLTGRHGRNRVRVHKVLKVQNVVGG